MSPAHVFGGAVATAIAGGALTLADAQLSPYLSRLARVLVAGARKPADPR